MPSKTKASAAADKAVQLQIPAELLDQLVTGPMTAGQVQGLFDQFKKAVLERALAGEMSHHLGYAAGQAKPEGAAAKHRNGKSAKSEVSAWQSRPLDSMYPVVFFDALRVKIREDGVVRAKAVYLALGVLADGSRDILGVWVENTEGAKFWMKVFNDLKTRGVQDILIAVTDGLKGMPDALGAVFPATTLQTCIVHLISNSLDFASWKDRKALAAAIKPIYTATNADVAEAELDAFEAGGHGVRNSRPLWVPGAGPGTGSFRSLPSRPRCGA